MNILVIWYLCGILGAVILTIIEYDGEGISLADIIGGLLCSLLGGILLFLALIELFQIILKKSSNIMIFKGRH